MKKYLRLHCTNCRRDIDKLVDITHYTPDRCTITQGCEGRLQPIEYRSSAQVAVTPEVGITDWQPRGTKVTQNVVVKTDDTLINLQTGSTKQLVIASQQDFDHLDVVFKGMVDTPKSYRSYIFRKEGSFTTIAGVESGLEKKTLRFNALASSTNPDLVEVYVNGVKREHSSTDPNGFLIYDGLPTFPYGIPAPNTIVFNTPVNESGITQVDVVVSKTTATTSYTVRFDRTTNNEARAGTGAYENIGFINKFDNGTWVRYNTYHADLDDAFDNASVPLNTLLQPSTNAADFFLLARKPYTQLDRYSTSILPISSLMNDGEYIKYYAKDSVTTAMATATSLANIFPPIRFLDGKFSVEKIIKTATAGVEEQLTVDGNVIVGPDA